MKKWHSPLPSRKYLSRSVSNRDIEEAETWEAVLTTIDKGLHLYRSNSVVSSRQKISRASPIKDQTYLKFDSFKADEESKV
jgi:topoisomerase-4 subunit A